MAKRRGRRNNIVVRAAKACKGKHGKSYKSCRTAFFRKHAK